MKQETQPQAKPRCVRGAAKIYPDDSLEFTPYGKGEPQKSKIAATRRSELYSTVGRNPKKVARIVVDGDTADVANAMYDELDTLIGKLEPKAVRRDDQSRRSQRPPRVLHNGEGLNITCSKDQLLVSISISLIENFDYKDKCYNLVNETAKCLAYNRDFMSQQLRALASGSTK